MAKQSPPISIRPFKSPDNVFLASIAQRLSPQQSVSPRDPVVMEQYFADLAHGGLLAEPGSEAFVATIEGTPVGIIAVHPDADYFTGHPRGYVDVLVVAEDAEGRGVGRVLMCHVEQWARDRGCLEVVLDVFAGNAGATAFYERNGYRPDHIRMTKSLA